MVTKIRGRLIAEFKGIRIYRNYKKSKRKGKDRVWIHIRQEKPKKWRVTANLSYAKGVDIQFEK